jgi:hypothetical protein
MFLPLVLGTLLAVPDPADKKGPPPQLELFAAEDFYKSQEGVEREFVGVLTKLNRAKGVVGFGRFNPYRLTLALPEKDGLKMREVYMGGKLNVLDPYVNRRVKVVGKAVDMEVEGQRHREIWPARLVLLSGEAAPEGKELKVFARSHWPYGSAQPNKREMSVQKVIRSAEELVAATPFRDRDALPQVVEKMAVAEVAGLLRVDGIDWNKQMLVVVTAGTRPTGGWRVEIDKVSANEDKVTVSYAIIPPKGFVTQAFTHPGVMALVEKQTGNVIFEAKVVGGLRPQPLEPRDPVQKDQPKEQGKMDLKVFGRTAARLAGGSLVIRSGQELAKVHPTKNADLSSAALAQQFKVDAIDWNKQMIVSISGGVQRSGGYSVELTGLEVSDKVLTIRWKLNTPRPGQPVTLALTNPGLTLLVERFEGAARFDPPQPKGGLDR